MHRSLILALTLAACGTPPSLDADSVAQTASADLAETFGGLQQMHDAIDRAESDRSAEPSTCVDAVGTCTWCAEWDGIRIQGTFATAPAALPCGGDRAADQEYTVDDGWLQGSWSQPADVWSLQASGAREATLRLDDGSVADTSFTVDDLTADFDEHGLSDWSTTLYYRGTDAERWTVQFAGIGGSFVGTITTNTGLACTVYGDLGEQPDVACAR